MNQIKIVKEVADSMFSISEIPSNEEFYSEFYLRLQERLNIRNRCKWERKLIGHPGQQDYFWLTECGHFYIYDDQPTDIFCPQCGCVITK